MMNKIDSAKNENTNVKLYPVFNQETSFAELLFEGRTMTEEEKEIPVSGAVFTFGRSRFADNIPSHFFIKNDPVIDVGCGDEHTAVVCQNGRVFVFGSNEWGQLGLGHCAVVTKPSCVKILKPEHATHVACGRAHTIISTGSGKVFACGNNSDGQLGVGDTADRDTPTPVEGVPGLVEQLAAGCHHSAALNNKGEVYVWGSNSDGQLGLGQEVKSVTTPTRLQLKESVAKIACGYYHTVLLTEEGQLLVCGEGEAGKLGLGSTESVFTPTPVTLAAWPIYVAAGGNHTFAVAVDGKVYGWGSNWSGQLGLSNSKQTEVLEPTLIHTLGDKVIREVACGESHTAFVTELGELLMCGETRHGKLGCETVGANPECTCEPTRVPRFKPFTVTKVRCGGCHTMALASPRTEDTDDHLSNGHVSHNMLQLPEVDIVSPPVAARGQLPPLQRVPHVISTSTEDRLSRESSQATSLPFQSVPEVSVDLVSSNSEEKIDPEKEEEIVTSLSMHGTTPETFSTNEKSEEDKETSYIITSAHQQASEMLKSESQAVLETCENIVSMKKNAMKKSISDENGVAVKNVVATKKSKMCILL